MCIHKIIQRNIHFPPDHIQTCIPLGKKKSSHHLHGEMSLQKRQISLNSPKNENKKSHFSSHVKFHASFMFIEINVFILVTYFCTWNSDKTTAILSHVMILWVRNSGRAQLGDFSILYGVVTHLSVVLWWHMVWMAQDNDIHRSDALTEMAHVSIRVISGSSDLPYGSLRLQAWVFQQPRQKLHNLWCLSLGSHSATSALF